MTAKHFNAIAETLKHTRPEDFGGEMAPARLYQWERDRDALADLCAKSNPAFDRARFLAACAK